MMPLLGRWYDFRDLGNPLAGIIDALRDAGVSEGLIYVIAALAGTLAIFSFIGLTTVLNIWIERRVVGRIQVRQGPNRVGPFGLLQPVADAIKLIQKEMLTPRAARDNSETAMRLPALVLMGLIIAAGTFIGLETDWGSMRGEAIDNQARIIGESLINEFVLPFEVAAVLLTAALVGAIALAREDPEDDPLHHASLLEEGLLPPDEPTSDPNDAPGLSNVSGGGD